MRGTRADSRAPLAYGAARAVCDGPGPHLSPTPRSIPLGKPNYQREKRQKELDRQRKKEEKRQRKLDRTAARTDPPTDTDPTTPDTPPSA